MRTVLQLFPYTLSGKQFSRKLNTQVPCSVRHCCCNEQNINVVLRRCICSAYDCLFSRFLAWSLKSFKNIWKLIRRMKWMCANVQWRSGTDAVLAVRVNHFHVLDFFFNMLHNLFTGKIKILFDWGWCEVIFMSCFQNTLNK